MDAKCIQKKYRVFFENYDRLDTGEPVFHEKEWDEFEKDVHGLREKYNLPANYHFALTAYIQGGNFQFSISDDFWHLNPYTKVQEDTNCITLKIYPETSIDDIKKNWDRIKHAKDNLPTGSSLRKNKIQNLQRDITIYNLKKKGFTYKQIASKINKQRKKGTKLLGYEDIPKIIERLIKRADNSLAPKES